jgi:hypothetical protein
LGDLRVGRQPAADPQVEAGPVLGVLDADERDVVHLVGDVGQPGDGRLELARQVGELRLADVALEDPPDGRGAVDHLVGRDAGQRRTEDHPRGVAARLGGGQADRLQPLPDRRHVLDADPVVLHVLPVGDVGGVPGVGLGQLADHAQLLGGQRAAVDAHPQHEELVVELLRLQRGGAAALDARPALGVQAPPAKAPAKIGRVDRVEPALGVHALDAGAHVQPVVVLLDLLVLVERLAVAERPLAFTAGPPWGGGPDRRRCLRCRRCPHCRHFGCSCRPPCDGGCARAEAAGTMHPAGAPDAG